MTCRVCVVPKLVSNGCKSIIRSSRISICLMNTRCSGDEKIFTPLIAALESRDKVIVLKVFEEFLAHATLNALCRFQAFFLHRLDVVWNRYAADITFDADSR